MLDDATIERYSRQILVAEVGGRGQARLCESVVTVEGDGPAAAFAADLLVRAGVRVVRATSERSAETLCVRLPGDGVVRLRVAGTGLADAAGAQIAGAVLAGECLVTLVGAAPSGRTLALDLDTSTCRIGSTSERTT